MAHFVPGQRVQADISGTAPGLGAVVTPATVTGPGNAPNTYMVQTDAPFTVGGQTYQMFQLDANRLTPRP